MRTDSLHLFILNITDQATCDIVISEVQSKMRKMGFLSSGNFHSSGGLTSGKLSILLGTGRAEWPQYSECL